MLVDAVPVAVAVAVNCLSVCHGSTRTPRSSGYGTSGEFFFRDHVITRSENSHIEEAQVHIRIYIYAMMMMMMIGRECLI